MLDDTCAYGPQEITSALAQIEKDIANYVPGYDLPTPLFLSRTAAAILRMPDRGNVTVPEQDNTPLRLAHSLLWLAVYDRTRDYREEA